MQSLSDPDFVFASQISGRIFSAAEVSISGLWGLAHANQQNSDQRSSLWLLVAYWNLPLKPHELVKHLNEQGISQYQLYQESDHAPGISQLDANVGRFMGEVRKSGSGENFYI